MDVEQAMRDRYSCRKFTGEQVSDEELEAILEAESLGVASCIVGAYDPPAAREVFNIPENVVAYQFLMLGHADQGPSRMHFDRRPMEEVVVRGGF